LASDSDAADNEPRLYADTEAEFPRDVFVAFSHQHDFKPGMIARQKAGCSHLRKRYNRFLVVLESRDDEPLFDVEARDGTAGFRMPLDALVGKVDEDSDLISVWVDRRNVKPVPEERATAMTAWFFTLPMAEDRNLVLCFRNNRPMVFRLHGRFYNARCGRQARS
jgi:hypothetical protein